MTTLWLHGFCSSPRSKKALALARFHEQAGIPFYCPQLPFEPQAIVGLIEEFCAKHRGEPLCIGGSSLGGFFAMAAAQRHGLPAVLVNPAMRPWTYVRQNLGWHEVRGTGVRFEVCERHAAALEKAAPASPDGAGWIVMLSTADEVLDWTQARDALKAARQVIVEGGDHEVSNFEQCMQPLAQFCAQVAAKGKTQ